MKIKITLQDYIAVVHCASWIPCQPVPIQYESISEGH